MAHFPGTQDCSDLDHLVSDTCKAFLRGGEGQDPGDLVVEAGAEVKIQEPSPAEKSD